MANPENKQIPYESTQKDIRDAIESVATAIGGIAIPSANHVSYDNSGSGLSATDVQNALDEIVSDIPTVNDGTLTIQQNGETKGTFTANQSGNSTVNIETPTTDIQTAVDEFETYNGGILSSLKVALSPIQDLHGYDSPWFGGAGKNKFNATVDGCKAENTTGTWNGNVYSLNGITFTLNTDSDGNITSITINGTNGNTNTRFYCPSTPLPANTTYTLSGVPSGYGGTNLALYLGGASAAIGVNPSTQNGSPVTFTTVTAGDVRPAINVNPNITVNNAVCYPQLELGSTATSYVSYTNICPISGHTQSEVDVSDGQTTQEQVTVNLGGTYYSGTLDVVTGVFVPDTAEKTLDGSEGLSWQFSNNASYQSAYANASSVLPNVKLKSGQPYISNVKYNYFKNIIYASDRTIGCAYIDNGWLNLIFEPNKFASSADLNTFLSNNPLQIVYPVATPQSIQLSPTMVKALVGENHLDAPLEGQEITESKYKQMFTFDDVIAYIQSLS